MNNKELLDLAEYHKNMAKYHQKVIDHHLDTAQRYLKRAQRLRTEMIRQNSQVETKKILDKFTNEQASQ